MPIANIMILISKYRSSDQHKFFSTSTAEATVFGMICIYYIKNFFGANLLQIFCQAKKKRQKKKKQK
jgi:hypothetical protein